MRHGKDERRHHTPRLVTIYHSTVWSREFDVIQWAAVDSTAGVEQIVREHVREDAMKRTLESDP